MKLKKKVIKEEVEVFPSENNPGDIQAQQDAAQMQTFTSLLTDLIKDEWEAIDGYNTAIVNLSLMPENESIVKILTDIVSEEYIHIGQLEKVLQMGIPDAANMDKGEEEAEEQLGELPVEPVEELPDEPAPEVIDLAIPEVNSDADLELPEDDIPEEIADEIKFDAKKEDEEE